MIVQNIRSRSNEMSAHHRAKSPLTISEMRNRDSKKLLDHSSSPEQAGQSAAASSRQNSELRPGTVLAREWNGSMHRVAVLADGFAWNGNIYPSLSKIAVAITGTRWNGPRFFGLRDRLRQGASP